MAKPCRGEVGGGTKPTKKQPSILVNEPQMRTKTGNVARPIMGLKGIIESAYANSSEGGESELLSCLKKTKTGSTIETEYKCGKLKNNESKK